MWHKWIHLIFIYIIFFFFLLLNKNGTCSFIFICYKGRNANALLFGVKMQDTGCKWVVGEWYFAVFLYCLPWSCFIEAFTTKENYERKSWKPMTGPGLVFHVFLTKSWAHLFLVKLFNLDIYQTSNCLRFQLLMLCPSNKMTVFCVKANVNWLCFIRWGNVHF